MAMDFGAVLAIPHLQNYKDRLRFGQHCKISCVAPPMMMCVTCGGRDVFIATNVNRELKLRSMSKNTCGVQYFFDNEHSGRHMCQAVEDNWRPHLVDIAQLVDDWGAGSGRWGGGKNDNA